MLYFYTPDTKRKQSQVCRFHTHTLFLVGMDLLANIEEIKTESCFYGCYVCTLLKDILGWSSQSVHNFHINTMCRVSWIPQTSRTEFKRICYEALPVTPKGVSTNQVTNNSMTTLHLWLARDYQCKNRVASPYWGLEGIWTPQREPRPVSGVDHLGSA